MQLRNVNFFTLLKKTTFSPYYIISTPNYFLCFIFSCHLRHWHHLFFQHMQPTILAVTTFFSNTQIDSKVLHTLNCYRPNAFAFNCEGAGAPLSKRSPQTVAHKYLQLLPREQMKFAKRVINFCFRIIRKQYVKD